MMPKWISPIGLSEHIAIGAALAALLRKLGAPRVAVLVAILAVGIAHEQAQRDWTRGEPGWFVLIEVAMFALGACLLTGWPEADA